MIVELQILDVFGDDDWLWFDELSLVSLGNVIQRTGVDGMCTALAEVIVSVVSLIIFSY